MDEWINFESMWPLLRACVLMLVGLLAARLMSRIASTVARTQVKRHDAMLVNRGTFYVVLILFLVMALRELGFDLSVLLGAAGIVSVALGFASQTSASNLISGLFLLAEKPFALGDLIRVDQTTGEVISLDLLSIKLRTFDNLFVRIPNETLIKSEVTTLTKFPIRRIDIALGVAYKEDLPTVQRILFELAKAHPYCLDEPKPLYMFLRFGESSLDLQFSVWAKRESFLTVRTTLQEQIKAAFDAAGIEIPFPHRTLYTGATTEPFPVRQVDPVVEAGSQAP